MGFITAEPEDAYVRSELGELAKLHANRFRMTVLMFLVEPVLYLIVWGFISLILWGLIFGFSLQSVYAVSHHDIDAARLSQGAGILIFITLVIVPICAVIIWLTQLVRLFFLLLKKECES